MVSLEDEVECAQCKEAEFYEGEAGLSSFSLGTLRFCYAGLAEAQVCNASHSVTGANQ
jgi:hypothetical protein